MSDDILRIRDEISYIREMVEDDGSVQQASGIGLIVAGSVFGLAALRAFALASGWLHWPAALQPFLPWDAIALFFVVLLPLLAARARRRSARAGAFAMNATSRTVWASWAAVGFGYAATAVGLSFAGSQAAATALFAFWGSGWLVAAAAYRRAGFAIVALGCYLVTIASGLLAGHPQELLLQGLALWGLVALPGVMVLRQSRTG
jgi:hypothetical protein